MRSDGAASGGAAEPSAPAQERGATKWRLARTVVAALPGTIALRDLSCVETVPGVDD